MDDSDLRYTFADRIRAFARQYRFALVAAAIASLVIVAYIIQFASAAHWRWSGDTENWSRFGQYVGGLFGVFAFVGVLITVELQRQQLSQLAAQATIDELHRICRDLASSIDDALDGPLIFDTRDTAAVGYAIAPTTMRGVLELAAKTAESDDIDQLLMPTILANQYGPLIRNNAAIVRPELDQLAACLEDALLRGGSGVVFSYYRAKYRQVVLRMKVMAHEPESVTFWK